MAFSWLKQADIPGLAYGTVLLGDLYLQGEVVKQDTNKALECYNRASIQNEPLGNLRLSQAYKNGWGVQIDSQKAEYWYKKAKEKRIGEISDLKKHIFNYSKTRETYEKYRKSGYSKKFYEEHREELQLHKAAKEAFNAFGLKKLPSVKELNAEFNTLVEEKRKAYAEYREAKEKMQDYVIARQNVEETFATYFSRNSL